MEKLTLPEPAATLWGRVQPILDHLALRWVGVPNLFSFGGGTILASRWGHRESRDIDIVAKRGSGLRRALEKEYANSFAAACERAGALEIEYLPLTATITVTFPEGDWDLSELEPPLPGQEGLAEVDGARIQTLSTSQILAGKLIHRGFQGVVRDIFDLAVALTLDKPAFDQAASLYLPADLKILVQEIRSMANGYRNMAPANITLAGPQWGDLLYRAPEAVADALECHIEPEPGLPSAGHSL